MRTGCHGNVTKSGRGWIVLFEELTEVRMDAETSEGAVSQPTENEPEPPSAEQPSEPQVEETPREGTESEQAADPAAVIENEAAGEGPVEGDGDGAARESEEKASETSEKADTAEGDVQTTAENGVEKEAGEGDGAAEGASNDGDVGEKAETTAETQPATTDAERASNNRDVGEKAETTVPAQPATATDDQSQETDSTPKETRRKDRDKKKGEKKRKKTKTPREEGVKSSPRSRKRGIKSRGGHNRQLEEILVSVFLPFDPEGNGTVDSTTFWEILQSPELNLQLEPQELAALQEIVTPDRSGLVSYAEFAAQAGDIIASLYQEKPTSEDYRVRMATPSGHRVLSYNKQTGQFQDLVEEGVDPFEENILGLYQSADNEGRGFITREEFIALFQLKQLALLTEEDHSTMIQYFDQVVPEGQAQYQDFYALGKELILRLYRNQDTTESEWIELQSEKLGRYQLNKYTGEIQRDAAMQPDHVNPQIDLINQAYRQAQEAAFETEQYKEENRELQNQLRLMGEEQETLTVQLEQTGHVLDEANAEIREKEEELGKLQAALVGKEHEIEDLKTQLAEAEVVKEKLQSLEQELEIAQEEVVARGMTMEARDSSLTTLQKQSHGVVDKLKTAWATIEARDSTIAKLRHQLTAEQSRMKTYQQQTPLLEAKVSALEAEVKRLTQSLDEKNSALNTSRKHLKNSRERNMELEKVAERAVQTEDKLKGAESEIRTLKGLLTSKTAMVERRKREVAETRAKLLELEERDSRRAIILADVLERTARQYQQTLQVGGAQATMNLDPQLSLSSSQNPDLTGAKRPVSAPSVPPEQAPHSPTSPHLHTFTPGTSPRAHPPQIVRTYTTTGGGGGSGVAGRSPMGLGGGGGGGGKTSRRGQPNSHLAPKLPQIRRRGHTKSLPSTSFHVPTAWEVRELQRRRDKQEMVQHSASNPRCACQLCAAGGATAESIEDGLRLDEQVALAGLAGSGENSLARQVRQGQRILISMKKSDFDLEPQQYTGIVKYVGKIDSEFIDNRIYVGVKLDEPVGDTDGLVKGKRYFNCPARHGKVVRLSNVVAILPRSSVSYKSLQSSKRSPYTTSAPSSLKRTRVKVT